MARTSGPLEGKGETGKCRIPEFARPAGKQVYPGSSEKSNSYPTDLKGWMARIPDRPPPRLEKAFALIQRKGIKWRLAHFRGQPWENQGAPMMQVVGVWGTAYDPESIERDGESCCECELDARN
jgi:hypothetical protein